MSAELFWRAVRTGMAMFLSWTIIDRVRYLFDPRANRVLKYSLLSGFARAVSSEVEHCLHTAGVTGSTPVSPTMEPRGYTQV